MKIAINILWVISWVFCVVWAFHIVKEIGWDTPMPMKLKLPLVLSLFGPPLIYFLWILWSLYDDTRIRKNEPIENKFDINR